MATPTARIIIEHNDEYFGVQVVIPNGARIDMVPNIASNVLEDFYHLATTGGGGDGGDDGGGEDLAPPTGEAKPEDTVPGALH